ncbi:hypothetical protein B296_00013271 [Ensete ventricosum]|uniref:Uncharacterized protein n=1 Tax=Ensete ventricosum TaxID=4639 RepID=A0A427A245_ENSVE|nr:hypothetical protein B296_00013271 [Ensete ventricosum]
MKHDQDEDGEVYEVGRLPHPATATKKPPSSPAKADVRLDLKPTPFYRERRRSIDATVASEREGKSFKRLAKRL